MYRIYIFIMLFVSSLISGQKEIHDLLIYEDEKDSLFLAEHLCWGNPAGDSILARQGYVLSYNNELRIPGWVAYHIKPGYIKFKPARKGRFSRFRTDKHPYIKNPVSDKEYKGLNKTDGFARGHLAPYAVMGGDRDNDSLFASEDKSVTDKDDELTIFEANYMSNIAPQYHNTFNGAGGMWYKLEQWAQKKIVLEFDSELWVYAGALFLNGGEIIKTGKKGDIAVPDHFYKMLILRNPESGRPEPLLFLFPHYSEKEQYKGKTIFDHIISVNEFEELTDFDFFDFLPDEIEEKIESEKIQGVWKERIK